MTVFYPELETMLGVDFFDYQLEAFELQEKLPQPFPRIVLYYRTGAGKSITALCCVRLWGATEALVVAPPVTHPDWIALGEKLGMKLTLISHAKFRQKDFKVSRYMPLIMDEFHLLGGHNGQGWKKLDRLAPSLEAPLIIASATPNYNDAERVYCLQHVCDPNSVRGGFLEFLYKNCITKQNNFSLTPLVEGFIAFASAEEYLKSLPYVVHVPDLVQVPVVDIPVQTTVPDEFVRYGLNRRSGRIMASRMEKDHAEYKLRLVDEEGYIRDSVLAVLEPLVGNVATPTLMFCNSEKVARALYRTLQRDDVKAELMTGSTSGMEKERIKRSFIAGELDILVGTATLATGADGFDKVCDQLIIVNDTADDALRRQLAGRILPRGADADSSRKQIYRLLLGP